LFRLNGSPHIWRISRDLGRRPSAIVSVPFDALRDAGDTPAGRAHVAEPVASICQISLPKWMSDRQGALLQRGAGLLQHYGEPFRVGGRNDWVGLPRHDQYRLAARSAVGERAPQALGNSRFSAPFRGVVEILQRHRVCGYRGMGVVRRRDRSMVVAAASRANAEIIQALLGNLRRSRRRATPARSPSDWAELQRSHVSCFTPHIYVFLSDPGCLMRQVAGAGVSAQTPSSGYFLGCRQRLRWRKKGRETP
jgi:hypothetical protein